MRKLITAVIALGLSAASYGVSYTFDFSTSGTDSASSFTLWDTTSSISLEATGGSEDGPGLVGQSPLGLGIVETDKDDDDDIDGGGPNEYLELDLGSSFRILEILINNVDDNDDGVFFLDGTKIFDDEIVASVDYSGSNLFGTVLRFEANRKNDNYQLAGLVVESVGQSVPDNGATLGMLGFGLVALGLVRRRSAK